MNNQDYMNMIKLPLILLVVISIISVAADMMILSQVDVPENEYDFIGKTNARYQQAALSAPKSIFMFLLKVGVLIYAGFTVVRKFGGTVKNALLAGGYLGAAEAIVTLLIGSFVFFVNPTLQKTIPPIGEVGIVGIIFPLLLILITSIVFNALINGLITAVGGFAAKQFGKK